MKEFNEDFRTKLYQTIEDIENNSLVEVVSIIREKSEKYNDIGLKIASIVSALVFTVLFLIPVDINPYLIYVLTIVSFLGVLFLIMLIPPILRMFIPAKRTDKSVEIMGRAIFQKGGVRFTNERIGVLIFVSYLEQKAIVIADRGVEQSVPLEDLEKIQNQLNSIFVDNNPADNLLKILASTKDIFSKYIPPIENDINELPDNLKVDL